MIDFKICKRDTRRRYHTTHILHNKYLMVKMYAPSVQKEMYFFY